MPNVLVDLYIPAGEYVQQSLTVDCVQPSVERGSGRIKKILLNCNPLTDRYSDESATKRRQGQRDEYVCTTRHVL